MKIKRSKLLDVARKMPPLHHTIPGEKFCASKSEVFKWFGKQPELLNYLINNIKSSGDIIYNAETGTWQGVEWCDGK